MTPETILEKAEKAGVTISVSRPGKIKASGDQERVNQFLPIIRDNKEVLVKFLQRKPAEKEEPFIAGNELKIPTDCDQKYRYWQDGQSIFDTLIELGASADLVENYISPITNPEAWRRWEQIKETRNDP